MISPAIAGSLSEIRVEGHPCLHIIVSKKACAIVLADMSGMFTISVNFENSSIKTRRYLAPVIDCGSESMSAATLIRWPFSDWYRAAWGCLWCWSLAFITRSTCRYVPFNFLDHPGKEVFTPYRDQGFVESEVARSFMCPLYNGFLIFIWDYQCCPCYWFSISNSFWVGNPVQ